MSARRFALASLLLGLAAAAAPAQTVYVTGSDNSFGSFDLGTLQYTQIAASLSGGDIHTGLTPNGSGGFYSYSATNQNPPFFPPPPMYGPQTLSTITLGGSAANVPGVGTLNGVDGIAVSPGGTLYAILPNTTDGTSTAYGSVGTVDPATGSFTAIGNVGNASTRGAFYGQLAFSGPTLYAAIQQYGGVATGLYSINTATGAATQIGPTDSSTVLLTMNLFDSGASLYGVSGTTVYSIDTTAGTFTSLGGLSGAGLPGEFTGAYALTPTPEPVTLLGVAAAGLGVAGWVRRRRQA